ncbi:4-hydroxy-tetrahydrodipicolinate reductase, partial [termite gut metagenome]
GHQIVSIIDMDNQEDFESEAFRSAEVAIEFTNPTAAYHNCIKTFKAGVKLVSGSTGWTDKHGDEIKEWCVKNGKTLFWASNFSLGVGIFSAINNYLAEIMNHFPDYDISMTETHHVHKLDAPSGTAITLAEGILEHIERKNRWVKEVASNSNELPIYSIREDEVFGIHTICYESAADSIRITHDAKNRGGFALGAILAAEFIADKQGFFGMNDLFKF